MGKQSDWVKTQLRLPRDLHKQIGKGANDSQRSFNAEVVVRLEESVARQGSMKAAA